MSAPALASREARELLDRVRAIHAPCFELDREVFEAVYKDDYKSEFERFCEIGELPGPVVAFCNEQVANKKP